MNVYIGDRIENLDLNQEFIEFDEDVFYYILDIAEDLPTNIDVLSLINPEADTVISGEDLYSLVNILEYILRSHCSPLDINSQSHFPLLYHLLNVGMLQ